MNILWDEDESNRLKAERGISLDDIAAMILEKKYVDVVKHPKRPGQRLFLVSIEGYIHVVPFVIDGNGNIVLKTAFPSRKFQKRWGGKHP